MSQDTSGLSSPTELTAALAAARTAEECIDVAGRADAAGAAEVKRDALARAIALDRRSVPAFLAYAAEALEQGDQVSAFSLLEEASRVGELPSEVEPLRAQLFEAVRAVPELEPYFRTTERMSIDRASNPNRILVLAPEWSAGSDVWRSLPGLQQTLSARGHEVTAWPEGALRGPGESTAASNPAQFERQLASTRFDAVLAVGVEGPDFELVRTALRAGVPVLHWIGKARPSFAPEEMPTERHYRLAPVSDWTATALRSAGYETSPMETLSPGVSLARTFRVFLPEPLPLRIGFIGPLAATSGAEALLKALAQLRRDGVKVTAELAGAAADAASTARFNASVAELGGDVRLTAPSGGDDALALAARTNVMVFPAQVPSAFSAAILEAMAGGTIPVVSNVGGAKELIRDGTDGLLIKAGDAADIARKLASLAADAALVERLQRGAQGRAMQFGMVQIAQRLEAMIQSIQAARPAGK